MYERFSDTARKVMQLANQEAQRFNHEYIGTEHILLGLVKEGTGVAANVLKNLDIDLRKIRMEVEKIVQPGPEPYTPGRLPQTPRAKKVIEYAIEEARNFRHDYVGTEHLLLGLLREGEAVAAQVLMNLGLRLDKVRQTVLSMLGTPEAGAKSGSKTPALDGVGRDLTALAEQGKLEPYIGRQGALETLAEVLGCRRRNSAVLVGEPGVGKTAIVVGLAQAIIGRGVPDALDRCRLVEISLSRIQRETRDRAENELHEAILHEVRRVGNVVLYLPDELRVLAAPQGGAALHALQAIHREWFRAIERGELRCILEGTRDDYDHGIGRHGVLHTAIQPVPVPPATIEETAAILHGLRSRFEAHHHIRYADDAVAVVVRFADQQLPGVLPAKALLLFDRAGARGQRRGAQSSREMREAAARLTDEMERLTLEKEKAVAEHEFDRAGQLRDRVLQLKSEREALQAEENQRRAEHGGTVDAGDVAETVRALLGGVPTTDPSSQVTAIKRPGS
jgi:ATP-dependent Clp protease ATP-binding subunit ClpC